MKILNLDSLRQAALQKDPYPYVIGSNFLQAETIPALASSFPDIRLTGFHPAKDMKLTGAFGELIKELEGQELSQVLSDIFGIDFTVLPRLITIRKLSAVHEGRIHCDGKSKVMSLLVYMNEGWQHPDGRLRVLRDEKDFENYAAEINPDMGTVFAFLRSDHSWHGHKPFVGERRVVQVAWVRSLEDMTRKRTRHRISNIIKWIRGERQDNSYDA